MPCSYQIDQEKKLVITTGEGVVTTEEILEHECALLTEPEFEVTFNQLVDFRQATKVITTGASIRHMATIAPWGVGSRRAAVMPDQSIFGLGRMYEIYNQINGSEWHVFKTIEEAEAWLGESDHSSSKVKSVL